MGTYRLSEEAKDDLIGIHHYGYREFGETQADDLRSKKHDFLKLDFAFPGNVRVFERDLEGIDQAAYDTMRLNCYLSQDGDFVTVWYGLIDAHMTERSLGLADDPTFEFAEQYEETLFRGYIADNDAGAVILQALRLEEKAPNILIMPETGSLECRLLKAS